MAATQPSSFVQRMAEACRLGQLALRLTWRASPRLLLGILLLLAFQAFLRSLQLVAAQLVVDRLALELGLARAVGTVVARYPLAVWIALAAVMLAVAQLIRQVVLTFQAVAADRVTGYVTQALILAANRWQGLARFEDPGFADDLERARTRAARSGLDLLRVGGDAVLWLFIAAGCCLLLVGLHPLAPVVIVVASVPRMVHQWDYSSRTTRHLWRTTPEARRLQYLRDLTLTPDAAKDVRLYDLGGFLQERYEAIFARMAGPLERLRRETTLPMTLAHALAAAGTGAVYLYAVWLAMGGDRTLGELVLYGGAAVTLQQYVLDMTNTLGVLPNSTAYLPSLFRVLDAPPDLEPGPAATDTGPHRPAPDARPLPPAPRPAPRPMRHGITFDHVAFAYPPSGGGPAGREVLRDVSFTLRSGESVALVGQNGAGKTTLVKLLLRLYDPTAGRILLDGVDLRAYDLASVRREMGVIFQDFVRYELTAGENIAVAQLDALHDSSRLAAAAARAGADEVLAELPQGLDTPLGREFGGRELSGGEWQKLALARAFVRDSQVLVLDEPTAALDVQAEYDVYRRFHKLTQGRTTLLISHRFSTVRMADRILVLADGAIQEEGTHQDLMARGGAHARLYRLQAAQYVTAAHATKDGEATAGGKAPRLA